jgi:hypothetical protein
MEPIIEFKNTEQAIGCLKEWQDRLALNEWIIKVYFAAPHEFKLKGVMGECEYDNVNKCAVISIMKPEFYGDRIMKYCAELTLVHELLHCKLGLLAIDDGYNNLLHQTQEDIAKAFIMAKYGISREWFSDISYE